MINDSFIGNPTRFGTAGGLFILLININSGDVVRTIVLAVIGATISFIISLLWKWLLKKWKRG
jgi:hypothetical protein